MDSEGAIQYMNMDEINVHSKRCCSRTCVAGVVAVILLLLVLAVCLILILTAATGNGKGPQQPGENDKKNHTACPPNWEAHGKKCYFFHKLKAWNSWNISHKECANMNASLVIIENKEELDYLTSQSACCYYLLGLRYSESEKKWRWINGVVHNTDMFEIQRDQDYFCAVIREGKVQSTSCTGDSTTQNMCEKAAGNSQR
ncbi:killer cell lectin-like receptor subfamily B member 1B allele B [Melanerpes formicivorus]|uniref:killer cell lectin-like receptor subfamily B member 1B allele B n=1 Tax=Melanerpes formicivorus TaxID=211600 RepID=UPI00358F3868